MRLSNVNFGMQHYQKPAKGAPPSGFKGTLTADGIYLSGTGVDRNADTLPDSLKEQIREQARKDILVGDGDYMSKDFAALEQNYMKQHISPDRGRAISQTSGLISRISVPNGAGSILDLYGLPFTAKIHVGLTRKTSAIFDEYGQMIASFNSDNGWTNVSTQAEDQYRSETTQVYFDAWTAARQEMQSAQVQGNNTPAFSALA